MISPGLTVIWVYLVLTYCLPCLFNLVFDLQSVSSYRIYPLHGWTFLFIIIFALGLLLLDEKQSSARMIPDCGPSNPKRQKWRLVVAISTFIIAFWGRQAGLNDFRYSEESAFASGPSLVYLVAIVPLVLKFDLFYQIFFLSENNLRAGGLDLVIRVFMSGALLLTINGTSTALFALLYLFYVLSPSTFARIFIQTGIRHKKLVTLVLAPFVIASIVGMGWILGETVKGKGNSEEVLSLALDPSFLEWAIFWLMERISSSYYSLLMALSENFLRIDFSLLSNLLIPIETLFYRIDVFIGRPFSISKPEIASLSRLNYELLSIHARDREGTSPGLIASFMLCFPFPVNIVALTVYTSALIRFMNRLVRGMPRLPNLGGLILIGWITTVLFESPFDLLVLLDDGCIFLFLLLLLYFKQSKTARKARRTYTFKTIHST